MLLTSSASKKSSKITVELLDPKFTRVVSLVYGHPQNLIKIRKESRSDQLGGKGIYLTFYVKGNKDTRRASLLRVMNDKTSLIKRLNDELKKVDEFATMSVVKLSEPIISRKPGNVILHNQTIKCNFSSKLDTPDSSLYYFYR